MKYKLLGSILIGFVLILSFFASDAVFAKEGKKTQGKNDNSSLQKTYGTPTGTWFTVNNVATRFVNDGNSDNTSGGDSGFEFPKGSGNTIFFQSGLVWGGLSTQANEFRVGGSAYRHGLQGGRITSTNLTISDDMSAYAEDPGADHVRIYRVRRDYATATDFSAEIDKTASTASEVYAQYEADWNEWPASSGAPYEDVDGNGSYDPTIDIPGFVGADQTIWFVSNDLDASKTLYMYGSQPLGLEMQATIWGYNTAGALGNTVFRKYKLVNKSATPIDSMYLCMWSDPDLGNAGDDYCGCDTTLSLGFIYNGGSSDATYGAAVPAGGFDYFQGPIVDGAPTDTAIFNNKKVGGKKNLPMSGFTYFINGDPVYADPDQGEYTGTLQFKRLMQGRISTTGERFTDPTTGQNTMYCLAGDPINGTGWVDGIVNEADDRRFVMVSGPFTMAPGDTQEVVVGQLAAQGTDRLSSVTMLKSYDQTAQNAYDKLFAIPKGPQKPIVTASALDAEVVLSWGNTANYKKTESYSEVGFTGTTFDFQGYNVYQLPTANTTLTDLTSDDVNSRPVLVATFDIVDGVKTIYGYAYDSRTGQDEWQPLQYGTDSGIQRYINISQNYLPAKSGDVLHNGSPYYYLVTSYCYNADPNSVPNVIENATSLITVVPHSPNPGTEYESETGSIIEVTKNGESDGSCEVIVVDPTQVNGHNYKVEFYTDTTGTDLWKLTDVTSGALRYDGITNQTGDENYPVVDGLMVKVAGPTLGIKKVSEVDANNAVVDNYVGLVPGASLGPNGYIVSNIVGASNQPYPTKDEDRFDYWGMDDLVIDFGLESVSWDYINETIHADSTGQITKLPFGIIRKKFSTGEDIRLFAGFYDKDGDGLWTASQTDVNWGKPAYEPIFAWQGYDANGNEINYDPANDAQYITENALSTSANITWGASTGEFTYPYVTGIMFVMYKTEAKLPDAGRKVYYFMNKANSSAVNYTFTAPSVTSSEELAKADVEKINVFPNPYYANNELETSKYYRFVTFSHLPEKAKIRIFNLAGQLVRTIDKSSTDQFEEWDLYNEGGLPVASGMYIVHIDMPDLGKTKILKLAIIQGEQILDRF
jgi:hypothetical protein